MKKQPFTPEGILLKQEELYSLNDEELLMQARIVSAGMKKFMLEHFSFTPSQESYLSNLPSIATLTIGCQLACVLAIRGSITMDDVPENDSKPKRPKQLKTIIKGSTEYVDSPSFLFAGDLSVHIGWKLL